MSCPFCHKDHTYSVEDALSRLAAGPTQVRSALAGAGEEELNWAPPKAWSPRQVAVHLLDTELVYGLRMRKILSNDDGVLPAYDQDSWADALTAGRPLPAVLDTFEHLRKDNLALLRTAISKPENLERIGRHPGYGELTLRDHILHLAPHDDNHSGQIRRTRAAYSAAKG